MKFSDLRLAEPILRAVRSEGYSTATPVQAQAIPHVLEGRDVLGCAQTGTGKTAAFALPILQRLAAAPVRPIRSPQARCLVLCPTRELASQIADSFQTYGRHMSLRHTVIFGGVNQNPQVRALRGGVDILIATPGRLLDLMDQGHVDLRGIEVLVLDEADRMLDMGFINDIRKIVRQLPVQRQTLMFSATIPSEIRHLAGALLRKPVMVQVAPMSCSETRIDEMVYFVEKRQKPELLAHLVDHMPMARTIVFTRTKHGADRVVRHLHTRGIRAEAIHGNKSQNARERALENFRRNRMPVLVATDIASRGIDIDDITHVVNFDLSHEPETYIHRIGRTARAGASGAAVSFCDRDEVTNLRAIERLLRRSIAVKTDHPSYSIRQPAAESAEVLEVSRGRSERPFRGGSQRINTRSAKAPARGRGARPRRRVLH
jgi:ATP-dependent RNA helicase RhlE